MILYPLMITCPENGAEVETGFAMSQTAFDAATLTSVRLKCPVRRDVHAWSIADARLGDALGVSDPP